MNPIDLKDLTKPTSGLKFNEAIATLEGRKVTYTPPRMCWLAPLTPIILGIYVGIMGGLSAWASKSDEKGYVDHRNDTFALEVGRMNRTRTFTKHHDDYWMPATGEGAVFGFGIFIAAFISVIALERITYSIVKASKGCFKSKEDSNRKIFKIQREIMVESYLRNSLEAPLHPKFIPSLLPYLDDADFAKLNFFQTQFLNENAPLKFKKHKAKFSKEIEGIWTRLATLLDLDGLRLSKALTQSVYLSLFAKEPGAFLAFLHEIKPIHLTYPQVETPLIPLLKQYASFEEINLKLNDKECIQLLRYINSHRCSLSQAILEHQRQMASEGDFTIHINQTSMRIGSSLLVHFSEYFRAHIQGSFKEKDLNEIYIQNSELDEEAIIGAFDFIKTGLLPVKAKNIETLIAFAEVARYYQIPLLAKEVERQLVYLIPGASNEELDAILSLSLDFHFADLHMQVERKVILMKYQPELLPQPYSKDFLAELCFITDRELSTCLLILQNHFIDHCHDDSFRELGKNEFTDHLLKLANINIHFLEQIFASLRPLFEHKPSLLKLLWEGGSSKKPRAEVSHLITEFCRLKENHHIMLAHFNAPPIFHQAFTSEML